MKLPMLIALIVALIMVVWTGGIFFKAMDTGVLWRQLASGISLLVFAVLFVLSSLKMIRQKKSQ